VGVGWGVGRGVGDGVAVGVGSDGLAVGLGARSAQPATQMTRATVNIRTRRGVGCIDLLIVAAREGCRQMAAVHC
jgi:hypothetical protein